MADNNQPRIVGYDPNTGAPIYANPSAGGKKAIKGVLIGIILLVVGVASWLIYDNFFNYTKVDLFAMDPGITVDGYSGSGYLENYIDEYSGDYVGDATFGFSFFDAITYTPDITEGLSNGDVVTITANYDKELAKKGKVKVIEDSKKYEVTGLKERYASNASDISAEDFAAMKQYMNDYMVRNENNSYSNRKSEGMVKLFYVSPVTTDEYDHYSDFMYGIYKVTYDGWDDKRETEYLALYMGPIDKGPNYAKDIDQLVNDGEITVYVDD